MAGECQLIAKFGFALGTISPLSAEDGFAGKIAHRIVFFAIEVAQGNWFWRLGEVFFSDYLFLMDGFLEWLRVV